MERTAELYKKAAERVPARVVLTLIAFLGTVFNYALRVSINLAMVAMVNHTAIPHINETIRGQECLAVDSAPSTILTNIAASSATLKPGAELMFEVNKFKNTSARLFGEEGDKRVAADSAAIHPSFSIPATTPKFKKDAEGPFVWDEGIQQLVISSFFWGYAITQVPGGRLSERFGVKKVMVVAMLSTALCSMLIPLAATMHFSAVIFLRVVMGLLEGPTFPSTSVLISRWAPPWERSRMFTYIKIGGMVGTVTVFPTSGLLIEAFGWESVFYFFGVLTILWLVAWWYLVYDGPNYHPRISQAEKDYVNNSLVGVDTTRNLPVPWGKILTCPRFWVATLCAISHGWGSSVLLSLLPTYLKIMMGFNIKANGFLSAVPYLGRVIVAVGFSMLVDWLIKEKGVHPTPIRKAAIAISGYGAAIGLLAVSFLRCQIVMPIVCLTFAVAVTGTGFSGNAPYLVELAPNYAGTTYGILNTGYAFTSIIGPLISGFIIKGEQTTAKWAMVFRIAAAFYITTATLFLAVAKAETQPWNFPKNQQKKSEDLENEEEDKPPPNDAERCSKARPVIVGPHDVQANSNSFNNARTLGVNNEGFVSEAESDKGPNAVLNSAAGHHGRSAGVENLTSVDNENFINGSVSLTTNSVPLSGTNEQSKLAREDGQYDVTEFGFNDQGFLRNSVRGRSVISAESAL